MQEKKFAKSLFNCLSVCQSQGHHKHHHAASESLEHGLHGDSEDSLKPVWTGLTALGGVYIMFLIEHFLTLAKMFKDKKQKVGPQLSVFLLEKLYVDDCVLTLTKISISFGNTDFLHTCVCMLLNANCHHHVHAWQWRPNVLILYLG